MWVVEIVLAWVVIAAAALTVWSMLRGMERQRDDWKSVADEMAMLLLAQPQVLIKGRHKTVMSPESVAVSRALARYNALLEPEA